MPGTYINRETGAIARVEKVDDHHAQLRISHPDGRSSRYAMPIADYDGTSPNEATHFSSSWREATPEDLSSETPEGFRPPANATAPAVPEEREDPEGVVISPELD